MWQEGGEGCNPNPRPVDVQEDSDMCRVREECCMITKNKRVQEVSTRVLGNIQ
jgi:hypothetical protein